MAVSSVAPRYGRPRRPQNRALIELFSSNADTNVSQSITGLPSAAARKGKCMSASPVLQVTCCCALAQLFCTSRVAPLCIDLRVTFCCALTCSACPCCCALTCSACPCCCALTCSACHVLLRTDLFCMSVLLCTDVFCMSVLLCTDLFCVSRVAPLCTDLVHHVTCCHAVHCPCSARHVLPCCAMPSCWLSSPSAGQTELISQQRRQCSPQPIQSVTKDV